MKCKDLMTEEELPLEAVSELSDAIDSIKKTVYGLICSSRDGVVPGGAEKVEKALASFLSTMVTYGGKHGLNEITIAKLVEEELNRKPLLTDVTGKAANVAFQEPLALNKKASALMFISKWLELGVDAPDYVSTPSLSSPQIVVGWRALRIPERRSHLTIELTISKEDFSINSFVPGRQMSSGVQTVSMPIEELSTREFFAKHGLCPRARHADIFNPLRTFNI